MSPLVKLFFEALNSLNCNDNILLTKDQVIEYFHEHKYVNETMQLRIEFGIGVTKAKLHENIDCKSLVSAFELWKLARR